MMYCIKRTNEEQGTISYYKYDGWESFPKEGPLDLNGVVLITSKEKENMVLDSFISKGQKDIQYQWYGAYKR